MGLPLNDIKSNKILLLTKGVNIVPEAVPVWPAVRFILDTGQYQYIVSGLPLFFIFINK